MKVILRVTIGDLMLRNSELDGLEIVQELGAHATCRIEFTRDAATDVSLDQLLRDPVTVVAQGEGSQPIELFQGEIGDGVQSHLLNRGSRFVLNATSNSERLEYVDTVYYPQSTLRTIAGKLGVQIVGSPRRNPDPFDYVQWDETEFAFLKRLADEHGCFLKTSGPEPEIHTEFQDKGWELVWGDTLLEVSARARPANHGVSGASYDPKEKSTHSHAGIRQTPAWTGGASKLVGTVTELAKEATGGGDPGLAQPSGRAVTHADFKTMLRLESERTLGGAVLVEGQSIKVGIAAGDLIDLVPGTNFMLPTTGKLGLIKVIHTFTEQVYANRFVATPWKSFTSLDTPVRPRMPGPVTAEVIETATDPDGMGRIKVSYRWQTGTDSTNWARLAVPHAGNGRGVMFLPEVGDEVVVAFENGDPERPIVIGALWNGKDRSPPPESKNTAKRIITRSGNTIQLLDDDGAETIEIHTPEGKALVQLTNKNGHPVVTIHSAGDIALQADQEIRLKCQKLVHDVGADFVVKAGSDVSFDAGKNAVVKAGLDAGLSGLNAVIKGGVNVETVAGALNNVVGTMVHLQPPGFVGKAVTAKPATVQKADLGDRATPEAAEPQRTADAPTPRS